MSNFKDKVKKIVWNQDLLGMYSSVRDRAIVLGMEVLLRKEDEGDWYHECTLILVDEFVDETIISGVDGKEGWEVRLDDHPYIASVKILNNFIRSPQRGIIFCFKDDVEFSMFEVHSRDRIKERARLEARFMRVWKKMYKVSYPGQPPCRHCGEIH